MLFLKIIFGIIVTLPILFLAEYLFEQTVDDALIGTTAKKKRVPLYKRILPKGMKKKHKKKKQKRRGRNEADADLNIETYTGADTDITDQNEG